MLMWTSSLIQPLLFSTPYFSIPFTKGILKKFVLAVQNYTNRRLAFTVNNKLNSSIRLHKNSLSKLHYFNVVYKISCLKCEASYIEQTKRKLFTRMKEHRSDINKTSGSRLYPYTEDHDFNWDNISILDKEPSYKKR